MFGGFIFWFVLSRITTTEIIGISSTVVSLTTISIIVSSIGIPSGVQRFLAKNFVENKLEDAKIYIKTSLWLISAGVLVSCITVLIAQNWLTSTFGIDFNLIIASLIIIGSSVISILLRSIVIASHKTRILPKIMIIAVGAKIVLALILVSSGMGALGIIIGFMIFPIISLILFLISTIIIFNTSNNKSEVNTYVSFKNIVNASVAGWIPSIITTIGSQLGTIVVFGSQGASNAGVYFVAFSVITAITAIMSVPFTVAYPTLSAMYDGRKRFAWRITKISTVIAIPISSSIFFYSDQIMQLFGQSYIEGAIILKILLLSVFPVMITNGINTLVYAQGNYKQVLSIGLAISIPRTILYFIFVPLFGGVGAAISFIVGAIMGLIISIIIAKKNNMKIFWKDLVIILSIPIAISTILYYLEINMIIAVIVSIITSFLLFLKRGIITKFDLQDSLMTLPISISTPLLNGLNIIGKKLNKKY